ncbi:hypothetical protein [Bacillus sp. V33-4]|uniref:hypothetical protein n=1 Tax=Bacillus sp. V33-4 TaxID=2054169 RepID=UPI000C782228|nr:hypothetical protein [Bacillus sp. V33-4]PLR84339.1 hypothetical protein CVD23_11930 [Bacillus sp. V33-4]
MKNKKWIIICILILLFIGFIGVRFNQLYSGADEAAHFDYINHIIESHQLPVLSSKINFQQLSIPQANPESIPTHNQHEAVQPPLYYVIASIIGGFFSDIFSRLMVLRSFGVLLLLGSFYLNYLTYKILVKEKTLVSNDQLFFVTSLIFIVSPYFISIMIPLNNEHLLLLLVSTLFYNLTKYFYRTEFGFNNLIALSLLMGAIILTKLTAAYLVIIGAAFLTYKKKYAFIPLYLGIIILMVSPWLYFNFSQYQSLTGILNHIEIVKPVVNPTNYQYTVIDIVKALPQFFVEFWFWDHDNEGVRVGRVTQLFLLFFSLILIVTVFFSPLLSFKKWVFFLYTLSIAGNISALIYATLTTPIFSLHGRYLYMNYIPFVLLTFALITNVTNKKYQTAFTVIMFVASILFGINNIQDLVF